MKKLRLYGTFLCTCLLFSSCNNDQSNKEDNNATVAEEIVVPEEINIRQPVVISGIVREASKKWITLMHKDAITGKNSYTAPIDENGNFQFSIELPYAQDLALFYTSVNSIYCAPGDSLHLLFNGQRYIDSLTFEGTHATTNVQLHAFLDGVDYNKLRSLRKKKRPRPEFLNLADRYEAECLALISNINPAKGIRNWMEAYTRSRFLEMKYAYGESNNIDPGDSYFNFLTELDTSGLDMKSCTETYPFIEQYYDYQLAREGLDQSLQLAYDHDEYDTYAREHMAFVAAHPSDVNKLALARRLYLVVDDDHQAMDALITDYSEVVQDEYLTEVIKARINYNQNKNEVLAAFTLDSLSKLTPVAELFQEIATINRNKVLYFDFWGTSCRYCIEEFPASVQLKKATEGKNIEFIYFCAPSEIKKQQKIIQRYQLEGQHYMLTRDQLSTLNAHFGFLALPRYMIVDQQGNFTDTNAKKPSADKILAELLALAEE